MIQLGSTGFKISNGAISSCYRLLWDFKITQREDDIKIKRSNKKLRKVNSKYGVSRNESHSNAVYLHKKI